MMRHTFTTTTTIEVDEPEDPGTERSLEALQSRCHEVVSALVTAFKYQRPDEEVDSIATFVETTRQT